MGRLVNKLNQGGKSGPKTLHIPSNEIMDIFDAADCYAQEGTQLVILAGKDYGSGSSRDWAAKGPMLLGVKVVLAESYERIHRSNLVGMGIIPLQYKTGDTAESLGLSGTEQFSVILPEELKPRQNIMVVNESTGTSFEVICRFDTELELAYNKHGGILNYMIRKVVS